MTLDLPMILVFVITAMTLLAFAKEWAAPDVIAIAVFCLLFSTQILSLKEAMTVFSNGAPLTIAAMFILTAALDKTGVIDTITHALTERIGSDLRLILLGVGLLVASLSAFVNNTPVVALFIPVLISLGRSKNIAASKLLIPLSYTSILGGCCTLMGTSTNILVNGVMVSKGMEPLSMFELGKLGGIFLLIGLAYIILLGPWLLPVRETITSLLDQQSRKEFLCHVLVKKDSAMVGKKLLDTPLAKRGSEFRILEVRRHGQRITTPLDELIIEPFDRILISASSRKMIELPQLKGLTLDTATSQELGIESLSTIEGSIVEGMIAHQSDLIGKSIKEINFRQKYGMIILALHRQGRNLANRFQNVKLAFGDTLLMLGPVATFAELRQKGDFMFVEDKLPFAYRREKAPIAIVAILSVILLSTFTPLPIEGAAILAVLLVLATHCMESKEAYQSVDWPVIMLVYGMLALGLAMEKTGAAQFVATHTVGLIETNIPPVWIPIVALATLYLITNILTEALSNNATALVMAPIAFNFAATLGVDPRPFVIAVCIASSAAFVTPIGYQTHLMVYGVGGYRFSDFLKFGLPLNVIFWITATLLIPKIWPLNP